MSLSALSVTHVNEDYSYSIHHTHATVRYTTPRKTECTIHHGNLFVYREPAWVFLDAKPTAADSELKTDIGDADSSGDDFFAQMLSNMMDMDMSDFTKWDAADMILVPNVIGMIKVATKTMSRTNGLLAKVHESSMEEPLTTELPAVEEMLFDTCGEVTKHVDELVDAAYVPMNKERLPVESHIICEHVQKVLRLSTVPYCIPFPIYTACEN